MGISIEDRKICVIDDTEYRVIYEFELAFPGWECDSKGYLINFYGEPRLVLSDHGTFEIVSREEIDPVGEGMERKDVLQLQLQLDSYRDLIQSTQKAIEIIKGGKGETI